MNCCFNFSIEKNKKLIQERGISFEEVIVAIDAGLLMDVVKHPNQARYPNQQIYVVEINDYIYLVSFVKENEESVFLKTIIPNRKAKKRYRGQHDE